jgi:hypothetical protein
MSGCVTGSLFGYFPRKVVYFGRVGKTFRKKLESSGGTELNALWIAVTKFALDNSLPAGIISYSSERTSGHAHAAANTSTVIDDHGTGFRIPAYGVCRAEMHAIRDVTLLTGQCFKDKFIFFVNISNSVTFVSCNLQSCLR